MSINSSGADRDERGERGRHDLRRRDTLLPAATQVTPGAHSLYLSIFDQGDTILDSAAFLDNLVVPPSRTRPRVRRGCDACPQGPDEAGEGRLTGGGKSADVAYILGCQPTDPNQRLQVKVVGGATYSLASVTENACTDDPTKTPANSSAQFDTMTGKGTTSDGKTIEWKFVDGGVDGTNDTSQVEVKQGTRPCFGPGADAPAVRRRHPPGPQHGDPAALLTPTKYSS